MLFKNVVMEDMPNEIKPKLPLLQVWWTLVGVKSTQNFSCSQIEIKDS